MKWEDILFYSCLFQEYVDPSLTLVHVLQFEQVSNKFYFTFSVHPEAVKDGVRIRNVVPDTEEEALRVIERMDAENSQIAAS